VGLLINNRTEWLEVAFGAWLLGAVATPFTTWCTRHELEYLLADSEVAALVALPRFGREDYAAILRDFVAAKTFARLGAVLMLGAGEGFPDYAGLRDAAEPAPTPAPGDGASAVDDAIILYTSGSTSKPKAIALAHYLVIENGFNIGERQGLGPTDKVLLSPPLFWTYGGVNALPAAFTHRAALVLQGRFDAGEALDLIERHGCTSLYTLPGMTAAMINHPAFRRERTRSLRVGMTIGSPQDVISAAEALGASGICNVYGSSETGGNCCVTHHDWPLERRANCQGLPLPGVELRIVDEECGAILAPNQPGLREGDVALIRTGWLETQDLRASIDFNREPGIDVEAALYLAESGVAVVGADNFAIEALPFPAGTVFPVHQRLIRDYGVPLLEGLVLRELGEKGETEFLFAATPLPIVGATGSPVAPVAVL